MLMYLAFLEAGPPAMAGPLPIRLYADVFGLTVARISSKMTLFALAVGILRVFEPPNH